MASLARLTVRLPTPVGDLPQQTDYDDIAVVDGVKLPFVIKQQKGGEGLDGDLQRHQAQRARRDLATLLLLDDERQLDAVDDSRRNRSAAVDRRPALAAARSAAPRGPSARRTTAARRRRRICRRAAVRHQAAEGWRGLDGDLQRHQAQRARRRRAVRAAQGATARAAQGAADRTSRASSCRRDARGSSPAP